MAKKYYVWDETNAEFNDFDTKVEAETFIAEVFDEVVRHGENFDDGLVIIHGEEVDFELGVRFILPKEIKK